MNTNKQINSNKKESKENKMQLKLRALNPLTKISELICVKRPNNANTTHLFPNYVIFMFASRIYNYV